jgi:hypothetical protein
MFRAQDTGLDPRVITAEVTELWQSADSGRAFAAALEQRGYILAKGDRRDFVIIDQAGDAHSLTRRIAGARAAAVRARMTDIDSNTLPGVAEAQALRQELAERHARALEEVPTGEPPRDKEHARDAGERQPDTAPDESASAVPDENAERAERYAAFDEHLRPAIESVEQTGVTSGEDVGWWEYVRNALEHYRERFMEAVRYVRDTWRSWLDRDNDPDLSR